ncbi:hypothetical protein NLO85_27845 [Pseudomonas savastanoi]|uniref:Uncharacterized protein n=1 Tax=Pseudomonas savastanoi TaxID=29438 RepID=A0AAW5J962_PSESS|nr:hypothetical protein [Pseudomonas savastanoi]MCQ3024232.1 hypothetical protein [Pseudomonas savastanoi]
MPTVTTDPAKSVVPLLAKTAVPRTGSDNLPGYYSPHHDMWVVETPDGIKPIIARGALDELLTKTKVNTEEDDDSFVTLETLTKTYATPESNDDLSNNGRGSHLLQLVTKTDTVIEEDDPGTGYAMLELMTKTEAELENDDPGDPLFGLDQHFYLD